MSIIIGVITFALLAGAYLAARPRPAGPDGFARPRQGKRGKLIALLLLVLTLSGLGMMIAAKDSNFTQTRRDLTRFGGTLVAVDRTLRVFGPEADKARGIIFSYTQSIIRGTSFDASDLARDDELATTRLQEAANLIANLQPANPTQARAETLAREAMRDLAALRRKLLTESENRDSSTVVIALMVWLTVLFGRLGRTFPRDAPTTAAMLSAGLATAGALFLLVELGSAFTGVIVVSNTPIRQALLALDKP